MKFRFSIRGVAWLTLVVAILLAWILDHRHMANRNRFTVETVQATDGEPILLRDNQSNQVLIKEGDIWKVAVPYGQPHPSWKATSQ
jgi:hypothetical protein